MQVSGVKPYSSDYQWNLTAYPVQSTIYRAILVLHCTPCLTEHNLDYEAGQEK